MVPNVCVRFCEVDVVGIPDSRVSSILKGIINSRDRFFEYLRFLLADDSEKEEVGRRGKETRKRRRTGFYLESKHTNLRATIAGGVSLPTSTSSNR